MKKRQNFGLMLNQMGLKGKGVEVGVCQGVFSRTILEAWKGYRLFLVDPWTHQGILMDKSDVSNLEHQENMEATKEHLKKFRDRFEILRIKSPEASLAFEDESLDFVYLDARHDYRSVMADLKAWYPKVKIGGILAGHDYKNSCVRKNLVEVKRAVDTFFCTKPERAVDVTTDDNLPSWYVQKQPAPREYADDEFSSSAGYGGWGHDE